MPFCARHKHHTYQKWFSWIQRRRFQIQLITPFNLKVTQRCQVTAQEMELWSFLSLQAIKERVLSWQPKGTYCWCPLSIGTPTLTSHLLTAVFSCYQHLPLNYQAMCCSVCSGRYLSLCENTWNFKNIVLQYRLQHYYLQIS